MTVAEVGPNRALRRRAKATFAVVGGVVVLACLALPLALAQGAGPTIGGCPVFPPDNIWNARVDRLPIEGRSQQYVASIGAAANLHPDFGSGQANGAPIGIPFVVVPMNQPKVTIRFRKFGDEQPGGEESDPGPYPVPRNAPIEGGPNSVTIGT